MAVFAGVLLVLLWRQQQAELLRSLEETCRAVSLAVDREVETSIERLDVLANQDSFQAERWSEFEREGRHLIATSDDWVNLLVFDAEGDELVNVRAHGADPSTDFDAIEYVERAVLTHRPIVSDLFLSPTTGNYVVHIAVPIVQVGRATRVLAASLELTRFDRLLADESAREDGLAGIYDRQLRYVARGRDSSDAQGMHVIPSLWTAFAASPRGTGRFAIDDGPEVYAAWTRSALTGWTVAFGVPAGPVETTLRSSLVMLAEVGVIVVLVTGLVAVHFGRQLSASITAATGNAMALAKGDRLATLATRVTELDVLSSALAEAELILRNESNERERVEQERAASLGREQQARCEAEAAGRAKDEFLAMLGHELRNPLAPILFAVELAKSEASLGTRELEIIERQAKHIERLVNDLLDVARIVQGKIELHTRISEVQPIIAQAVEIAAPLFERKQQVLRLDVPPTGMCVDADETRLAQVVANLLTNAAKFTAIGGEVRVVARREGDEVVIRVADDGVGISAELLPHIFDIFTQGKRSNETSQGLGLGLALVQSFVRLHHGTVSVSSAGAGQGSEFTVCLPAVEQEDVREPGIVEFGLCSTTSSARILVVDDNVDAAETLAALLGARAYEVRTAYDGQHALEIADEFMPEVAIVDIAMPVIDGYQVAQALARGRHRPHLIAVTGYGQEHDRQRSRVAGFDLHLVKPVSPSRLLTYLAELLG